MSVTEEELIRFVRTLDISAVERALCRGLSANTQTRKGNYNDITIMDSTKMYDVHGWLNQDNHGIKMNLEIQSIGSLLHVLTSMYYEIRTSVFNKILLEKYETILRLLLRHGADPNSRITHPYLNIPYLNGMHARDSFNATGETPLHFAVKQLDIKGIEILLENGANPYLSNAECKSVVEMIRNQNQNLKRCVHPYMGYTNIDHYAIDNLKIYNMIMACKTPDMQEN